MQKICLAGTFDWYLLALKDNFTSIRLYLKEENIGYGCLFFTTMNSKENEVLFFRKEVFLMEMFQ